MQEAIYHGVPLISLPLMSDQMTNAKQAQAMGLSFNLELMKLTEDSIKKAITEVMEKPKYRQEVGKRSKVFKDQEIHPLDRAIYWTEYVIRHEGAEHLKS